MFDLSQINTSLPQVFKQQFNGLIEFDWYHAENLLNQSLYTKQCEFINEYGMKIFPSVTSSLWYGDCYSVSDVQRFLNGGMSFVLMGASIGNKSIDFFCHQLEEHFNSSSDAHIYGGIVEGSRSFISHVDKPHNIIVQLEGKCRWQVFAENHETNDFDRNTLNTVIDVVLEPGDGIFIPSHQAHLCEPFGKRLSVSFPFLENQKSRLVRGWVSTNE